MLDVMACQLKQYFSEEGWEGIYIYTHTSHGIKTYTEILLLVDEFFFKTLWNADLCRRQSQTWHFEATCNCGTCTST